MAEGGREKRQRRERQAEEVRKKEERALSHHFLSFGASFLTTWAGTGARARTPPSLLRGAMWSFRGVIQL